MFKFAMASVLIGALLLPAGAGAQTLKAPQTTMNPQAWYGSATITCHRTASNAQICDRLLGPLTTISVSLNMLQDNPTPGIVFDAIYRATAPPPTLGAGIRPYGRVCAFGVLADHVRFIKGPFGTTTTCHATVRGRMVLRSGVATRLSKTPDFWITQETARVRGAQVHQIVDPLGAKAYPADTRFPVRWGSGGTIRDANRTLGVLGIPGFPLRAVPLPAGISASMTVLNIPLTGGLDTPVLTGSRAPHGGQTVPCRTVILEGGLTCYPPRSQRLAESQLAVRPVNPVGMVRAATHLRLTQVRIFFGFHGNRGVNLLYGFGPVCWSSEFSCATRYLVVGEAPGPSPVRGPGMFRDWYATGPGTPVRCGPWKFLAPVPGRNLVVTVYGSFSRTVIHGIGMRVLQAARYSLSMDAPSPPSPPPRGGEGRYLVCDANTYRSRQRCSSRQYSRSMLPWTRSSVPLAAPIKCSPSPPRGGGG